MLFVSEVPKISSSCCETIFFVGLVSFVSRESRDGGLAWSKVLRTVSSRLLPWRRYKICMASSTETDPLSSLSFMRNSTTLNRRRGSYPARTVERFIRNKAECVVLRHSEVLKLRVKRTSLVISTAMIHRLELWPVHALIAIIIHLPNHVFDIRLCGKGNKGKQRSDVDFSSSQKATHTFFVLWRKS